MSRAQESTGKRYPRSPRKFCFSFDLFPFQETLPRERTLSDETDQSSFSEDLFKNKVSVKIRNAAKESKFIQGMAKGTLNANTYGGYMVQDAALCYNAVEAFDCAAQLMQTEGKPRFCQLYRELSQLYTGYNQEFVKTWKLKNSESVVMGSAAKKYVSYESNMSRQDPKYMCIAMLPCLMLWPWIAGELISSVAKTNPYYGWFEDNKQDPNRPDPLKEFVDDVFELKEKPKCQDIFNEGMVNELNFFRDACDETLYTDYSFFNV